MVDKLRNCESKPYRRYMVWLLRNIHTSGLNHHDFCGLFGSIVHVQMMVIGSRNGGVCLGREVPGNWGRIRIDQYKGFMLIRFTAWILFGGFLSFLSSVDQGSIPKDSSSSVSAKRSSS